MKDLGQARNKPKLITSANRYPVRDAAALTMGWIEGVWNDLDLGPIQFPKSGEAAFELTRCYTFRQFANGSEIGSGSESSEGSVPEIHASVEQVVCDCRNQPDPIGTQN